MFVKPVLFGFLASTTLLGFYFAVLSLVSGWDYALTQFNSFKFYVLSLTFGFGIQIGLYVYLREKIREGSKKMVIATGATSTVTMISCCSHYLVNILPIVGITGLMTLVAQYQIQLFWLGIAANLIGIVYIGTRLRPPLARLQPSARRSQPTARQSRRGEGRWVE